MDWQRNLLLAAIVAVFAVLFIRWNEFQESRRPPPGAAAQEEVYVPETPAAAPAADRQIEEAATPGNVRLVTVETDVLRVVIDTQGGDLVRAELLQYPLSQDEHADPFPMLNRTRDRIYVAQSGLIGPDATDRGGARPQFHAERDSYTLEAGGELRVPLRLLHGDVEITKEFVFRRGDYLIGIRYRLQNQGDQPWVGRMFGQIQRDRHDPVRQRWFWHEALFGRSIVDHRRKL